MSKVIVTGCAGLLGAHFSRYLLANGHKVVGIDDFSGGYADYLPNEPKDRFELVPLDLSEGLYAQRLLNHVFEQEQPHAVYHFAAYAAEGLSPFIRSFNYTNNVVASANVINACINHNAKLIFTSSMAVYGDQKAPFTESMTPAPIDPYGVAKYTVEQDIRIAGEQHGLRYNIVRPHNVVGIYQNIWDRYRNVVGIFIRRVLDGEPILIYGDGQQTRAFSDIEFYMEPFYQMLYDHDREVFNIGADKFWSIKDVAETVCRVAKWNGVNDASVEHVEPRHEVKHAHCDHTKAKAVLEFRDNTDLVATIDKMFIWAQKEPKRQQKDMHYEVQRGLYDYWK